MTGFSAGLRSLVSPLPPVRIPIFLHLSRNTVTPLKPNSQARIYIFSISSVVALFGRLNVELIAVSTYF